MWLVLVPHRYRGPVLTRPKTAARLRPYAAPIGGATPRRAARLSDKECLSEDPVPLNVQHIERDLAGRLSVIEPEGAARNLVELADSI